MSEQSSTKIKSAGMAKEEKLKDINYINKVTKNTFLRYGRTSGRINILYTRLGT